MQSIFLPDRANDSCLRLGKMGKFAAIGPRRNVAWSVPNRYGAARAENPALSLARRANSG